jgi:hypothetical protein
MYSAVGVHRYSDGIESGGKLPSITLSDAQLLVAIEALECHVDGFDYATQQVIEDRSLDSPEQLLDAVAGMHDDFANGTEALLLMRAAAQRETVS